MKKNHLIRFILVVAFFAAPLFAQQGARPQAPAAPAASTTGAVQSTKEGIRFSLIDPTITPRTVYIPMDEKTVKRIMFRPNFPTERIHYPVGGKLYFYKEPPLTAREEGKQPPAPIFTSTIPVEKGKKLIGLIGKTPEGKMYIVYIVDEELKPGLTLLKNMTNKEYLLNVIKPPAGEKDKIVLKPGQDYIFGKNVPDSEGHKTYGTTLMHQVMFQGKPRWLPNRRFMLTRSTTKSFIKLLLPNPATKDMIISDITIMMDGYSADDPNRPSAANARVE